MNGQTNDLNDWVMLDDTQQAMSFLSLEGCHAFVTGAAGGIGSEIAKELLANGCKVTAHDLRSVSLPSSNNLFTVCGDISDEASISSCLAKASDHFGPVQILCANAGITNEQDHPNIWELDTETWDSVYKVNVRGNFLTIKHFLQLAKKHQEISGKELDNLAIVLTGSETGKFGQAGHAEYASGKAGLQYGLVKTVKNEIVRLNSKARINAVAPGWVDTALIGDRLDDPRELYQETQATVPLKKIAQPQDVARAVAFLASHRAAGHISGECLSVDGGMEGRIVWREEEVLGKIDKKAEPTKAGVDVNQAPALVAQPAMAKPKKTIKIALSVDFDAVSALLGTLAHPDNNVADYSAGYFAGRVGVPRILRVLKKLGLAEKTTWCIPGHSMETFPNETKAIVESGGEIALHGYSHESGDQMTAEQERQVLLKTIDLATKLTGKRPTGYRAPLYQLKERTVKLLNEHNFLWDSSLTHDDCTPYALPLQPAPVTPIDFKADPNNATWMQPSPQFDSMPLSNMVEIPGNWYAEDQTPLQYFPHMANTAGYTGARQVEEMWKDRFEWLRREIADGKESMTVYGLCLHPDTTGMAHIIGMVERFFKYLQSFGDEVEFLTCAEIATQWKEERKAGAR